MTLRIHKGNHRATGWLWRLRLWIGKKTIRKQVIFDFSCKYELPGNDQYDTNKLFGIGYLWSHHKDSARVGWRWDIDLNRFIISAYCYINGDRQIHELGEVLANKPYVIEIAITDSMYIFKITKENSATVGGAIIDHYHRKKFSFPLGLYFGGNKPAPHDMKIQIKNV
jgi:hypothetical protein